MTSAPAQPVSAAALPRKRMAATMFLTDPAGRVLLVKPTYKPRWDLPGGIVEAGESPREAAAREAEEELSLRLVPGRLLAVDYVTADASRTGTEGVITVFDGGTITAPSTIRVPHQELSGYAFVAPTEVFDYLPELQARRALAAGRARDTGSTPYLENGREL